MKVVKETREAGWGRPRWGMECGKKGGMTDTNLVVVGADREKEG